MFKTLKRIAIALERIADKEPELINFKDFKKAMKEVMLYNHQQGMFVSFQLLLIKVERDEKLNKEEKRQLTNGMRMFPKFIRDEPRFKKLDLSEFE